MFDVCDSSIAGSLSISRATTNRGGGAIFKSPQTRGIKLLPKRVALFLEEKAKA